MAAPRGGRATRSAYPAGVQRSRRVADHHPRLLVAEHDRAVGQPLQPGPVQPAPAARGVPPLGLQRDVDRIRAADRRVQLAPHLQEPVVVGPAAQRARPVAGGQRRRLVEEEQLSELARLQHRTPLPAPELQPAGDPAQHAVGAADPSLRVVHAAAVAVHEAAVGDRDQLAQRGDPVFGSGIRSATSRLRPGRRPRAASRRRRWLLPGGRSARRPPAGRNARRAARGAG